MNKLIIILTLLGILSVIFFFPFKTSIDEEYTLIEYYSVVESVTKEIKTPYQSPVYDNKYDGTIYDGGGYHVAAIVNGAIYFDAKLTETQSNYPLYTVVVKYEGYQTYPGREYTYYNITNWDVDDKQIIKYETKYKTEYVTEPQIVLKPREIIKHRIIQKDTNLFNQIFNNTV